MSNVVPLRPPARAHTRFFLARQDMNSALHQWLLENPPAEDVQDEIEATINLMRQLCVMLGGTP